ncbi:unnamed protein product [Caenorhabditis angaria]|uniref:Transducer of regulated CREB activity N-terminal domain-containing protein n=1 Tax=Caenorhabditis angaria TaxID=860376 RepID=A0A9P1I7M8_9PELO|nr:unnamed protein product [Caenorhabditis angaria]
MRMSSSGGTPRKFSEKIAILERKQNEENSTFADIMREVRSITTTNDQTTNPIGIPGQQNLLTPQHGGGWRGGQAYGSLPNVHQMPSYSDGGQPWQQQPWQNDMNLEQQQQHQQNGGGGSNHRIYPMSNRSRSPEERHLMGNGVIGHHYHPYGRGSSSHSRSPDRLPPQHNNSNNYPNAPHYIHHQMPQSAGYQQQPQGLFPPENWNQINRARSDPAIHNMGMVQQQPQNHQHMHFIQQHPNPNHEMFYAQNSMPGPSSGMIPAPLQLSNIQQQQNGSGGGGISPLQSPNMMPNPMGGYCYQNGSSHVSPMQSPMGSPHASSLMLDGGSQTPYMELSPPGMQQIDQSMGSLPNVNNLQQNGGGGYYQIQQGQTTHQPIGPRHSTGGSCGLSRLAPGGPSQSEQSSQSAPTSPHQQFDQNQQPSWPTRTFSNSPEALDIPTVVLTNAEGTPGQHLECFNDLQDLTLNENDLSLLCNNDQI